MNEWQPIDTAPNVLDSYGYGRRVLLWCDGVVEIGAWCRTANGGFWSNDEGFVIDPTHWQQLPVQPEMP
jgi:hypothetical protein